MNFELVVVNFEVMTLGAFGQQLTGNGWVDSVIIMGSACAIALLLKKVKDEFWPAVKGMETMTLSPSPLHIKKADSMATKDDIHEIKVEIDKIWDEVKDQRSISRVALGKIHARIDDVAKQTDMMSGEMKGELSGIKSTLDKLLERSLR